MARTVVALLMLVALASTACGGGATPGPTSDPSSPTPATSPIETPPGPTVGPPSPTPAAQTIDTACIDYTDGAYEGTSANEQGQALAVLFSPPSAGRWQVTHVRYHIASRPVPFEAVVFDRGFAELARLRVEPTSTGVAEIDLGAQDVVVDGDFYGALAYLQGSPGNGESFGPLIGRDSSMPDERSWVTKAGGVWKTWRQEDSDEGYGLGDGDFAIGACVRGPL